jgi:hypothetical protein
LFTSGYKRFAEGGHEGSIGKWIDVLIGCLLVRMLLLLLLLAVCVSVSLRTKTLGQNMGQGKSEGQDFKRD